ncbi:GNAT family N-acetyltransferase [Chitinimonas lacunae]|uniref:GNAT family N-acetyltransferase n=1 Tax=Chitinimonas lacunae TaxID=1963018 RepID=A0ABV8MU14_9NEIS
MSELLIRVAKPADAAAFRAFFSRLVADNDFMLPTAEEYSHRNDPEIATRLTQFATQPNHRFLLAWLGERLVGFLSVAGGAAHKNRGCGHVVVAVDAAQRRQGIGRALFDAAETWAISAGLWRLELSVMRHNEAARALYRAVGFEEEGIRRAALYWNGQAVDEVMMAKLLPLPKSDC